MTKAPSVVLGLLAAVCIGAGSASATTYFQENFDNQVINNGAGTITLNPPQVGFKFDTVGSQGTPFSMSSWSPAGNQAIHLVRPNGTFGPTLAMYGVNNGMVDGNTVEFSFDWYHDYIHRANAPMQVQIGMGPDYQNGGSAGPGRLLFILNNDPVGDYFYTDPDGNPVDTHVLPSMRGWDHVRVVMSLQKVSFGGTGYGFDYMTGMFSYYVRLNGGAEQTLASNQPLGYGIIPDDNPATVGYNEQNDVFWKIQKGPFTGDDYYDNVYSGSPIAPPTNAQWNVNSSGNWTVGGNWAPGVPNGPGTVANFDSAITTPQTVTIDSPQTAGMLLFNNANKYTIAGTSTLTLDNATDAVGAYVTLGSHQIDAPLALLRESTFTVKPASSTLTITNLQPSTVGITKSGLGTLVLNNIRAGSLSMDGLNGGTTTVGAGAVVIAPGRSTAHTSNVGSLGPFPTSGAGAFLATLDLNDNDMVINSGSASLATIGSLIVSGYNGGSWNGTGITSTAARLNNANPANRIVALGYADNGVLGYTTFSGQTVGANSILIKYTLAGDADVSGTVDTVDFNLLAANFSQSGKVWLNGDFNFNGTVDTVDFNLLVANFSQALPAGAATSSLVPEPAAVAVLVLPLLVAGRRERKRQEGVTADFSSNQLRP